MYTVTDIRPIHLLLFPKFHISSSYREPGCFTKASPSNHLHISADHDRAIRTRCVFPGINPTGFGIQDTSRFTPLYGFHSKIADIRSIRIIV